MPLPLTLYSYLTAWNTSVSLPLDNLPVREYFPGGRLYIEVFVDELSTDTVPANGSAAFSSPPAARIVVDDRNYVQGRLHSLNVGLIIGLLVPFGLLMFGTAFWYHRRLAKQRDAAHLAFLQQQVDVHGISYSAMMDPQDITKKQLRYRGNKARHGWF